MSGLHVIFKFPIPTLWLPIRLAFNLPGGHHYLMYGTTNRLVKMFWLQTESLWRVRFTYRNTSFHKQCEGEGEWKWEQEGQGERDSVEVVSVIPVRPGAIKCGLFITTATEQGTRWCVTQLPEWWDSAETALPGPSMCQFTLQLSCARRWKNKSSKLASHHPLLIIHGGRPALFFSSFRRTRHISQSSRLLHADRKAMGLTN